MGQKFQRTKEDFTCQHCGFFVVGNGYTNHCPQCLWSKHVDINPGDRANSCGGLMKPTALDGPTDNYIITHTCQKCGQIKRNKSSKKDSITTLIALAEKKEF